MIECAYFPGGGGGGLYTEESVFSNMVQKGYTQELVDGIINITQWMLMA